MAELKKSNELNGSCISEMLPVKLNQKDVSNPDQQEKQSNDSQHSNQSVDKPVVHSQAASTNPPVPADPPVSDQSTGVPPPPPPPTAGVDTPKTVPSKGCICKDCGAVFATVGKKLVHRKTAHPGSHKKLYPCPHCSKTFVVTDSLDEHVAVMHVVDEKDETSDSSSEDSDSDMDHAPLIQLRSIQEERRARIAAMLKKRKIAAAFSTPKEANTLKRPKQNPQMMQSAKRKRSKRPRNEAKQKKVKLKEQEAVLEPTKIEDSETLLSDSESSKNNGVFRSIIPRSCVERDCPKALELHKCKWPSCRRQSHYVCMQKLYNYIVSPKERKNKRFECPLHGCCNICGVQIRSREIEIRCPTKGCRAVHGKCFNQCFPNPEKRREVLKCRACGLFY